MASLEGWGSTIELHPRGAPPRIAKRGHDPTVSLASMRSRLLVTVLSWFVGGAFLALGVVEVVVRLTSGDPVDLVAIAIWSVTLIGGGILVLVGSFALPGRRGLGAVLVVAGCFLGVLGSAWTVFLPVLAIVLIFLRLRESNAALLPRN